MKVSALVSTYNAQKYIKGCLQNLIDQTLFKSGLLEIVVIDSGSKEDEGKIVSDFQSKYRNISYLRTPHRESLYAAWNRGISLAKGRYLTNANTDDRHEENCLEELANALDKNQEIDLVYGNLDKIRDLNEANSMHHATKSPCPSQEYFPSSLFLHYLYGAQPMWRSSLHENIGFFNANYDVVGDYEFALRLVEEGFFAKHVPKARGRMLWHNDALSTKGSKASNEKYELLEAYRNKKNILTAYSSFNPGNQTCSEEFYKQCLLDLGLRSLCFFPQFEGGKPRSDLSFFRWTAAQFPDDPHLINNLGLYDFILGNEISSKFLQAASSSKCEILMHNKRIMDDDDHNDKFLLFGPNIDWPTESQLKGIESSYLNFEKFTDLNNGLKIPTYSLDLKNFQESIIGKIDLKSLKEYDCICVWGINDKAKLLVSYLQRLDDSLSILLMDSNPASNSFKNFEVFDPAVVLKKKIRENCLFFLCMASIHWEVLDKKISQSISNFSISKLH